jgi:hypothetical protein
MAEEKPLTHHEIVFLYKEILSFHENINGKKFDIRHGSFQAYTLNNKIDILPVGPGCVKSDNLLYVDKSTYFSFINNKNNQTISLFAHIRNAFAHCNITHKKIHGIWFYCFKDCNKQKKLTMTGKLKQKQLKEFIDMLKTTEK